MPQHWDYRRAPAQCNLRTLIKALVATRTILRLGLNFGGRDEHVWLGKGPARGIGNRSALRSPSGARGEPEAVSDAGVQVLRCGDATVVDATRKDKMLHRGVVQAINGLVEYLQSERKRVPDEVMLEAERLECLLFLGYDPHFEGDEPPGL